MNKGDFVKKILIGLFGATLVGGIVLAPTSSAAPNEAPVFTRAAAGAPNVIVITSDDQREQTLGVMDKVQSRILDKGINFTNAVVPTSTCCPSRASFLTGNYGHTNGVWGTNAPVGSGWEAVVANNLEVDTLSTAFSAADYRTGFMGKYINGYSNVNQRTNLTGDPNYEPPGWDRFITFNDGPSGAYYDYQLISFLDSGINTNNYGSSASDYSTDVIAGKAVNFINSTPAGDPFFLWVTPYGPHGPYTPAPRHENSDVPIGYNKTAVNYVDSDKPQWVKDLNQKSQSEYNDIVRQQKRTTLSVDDLVDDVIGAVASRGELNNTIVVYMSDNGYEWGEFGHTGKNNYYDKATSVPLAIRWVAGGLSQGTTRNDLVLANMDVSKWLYGIAGSSKQTDGQSIFGSGRGGTVLEAVSDPKNSVNRPAYCGYLNDNWLYVRLSGGFEELYDLQADPFQLHNVALDPAYDSMLQYRRELTQTECVPQPPDFSWN